MRVALVADSRLKPSATVHRAPVIVLQLRRSLIMLPLILVELVQLLNGSKVTQKVVKISIHISLR